MRQIPTRTTVERVENPGEARSAQSLIVIKASYRMGWLRWNVCASQGMVEPEWTVSKVDESRCTFAEAAEPQYRALKEARQDVS